MKLLPCKDAEQVARRCADDVARVIERRPDAILILPAGNTPRPLFGELVRRQQSGSLDLSRAHIVQLDELVGVRPADSRSFHAFLRETLLDPLDRDGSRDHLMRGDAVDPDVEIARHAATLAGLGMPDLVVLGIGLNGHVAFNEPGTTASDGARRLPLAQKTLEGLAKEFAPNELPRDGITLGLRELRTGKSVRILATGAKKAPVIERLFQSEATSALPASLLTDHADLIVLVDEAAQGALTV